MKEGKIVWVEKVLIYILIIESEERDVRRQEETEFL